jgi:divalent metal cation (Fe/Co/Zn/Cd) transporter
VTDSAAAGLSRSTFEIPGMDCPSEERLVRLALDAVGEIRELHFDLPGRRLTVLHEGSAEAVAARLVPLGLGARLGDSGPASGGLAGAASGEEGGEAAHARTLWLLLGINAAMFVVEAAAGWLADSAGLLADSLDMLADATVYGLSLYAVGHGVAARRRAAHASGWLQLALAGAMLVETGRRFWFGSEPEPPLMMGIGVLALGANVACLWLISPHREAGAHMKASWIFSANDVIANLGVLLAAGLVAWTGSRLPDLALGTAIAALVGRGALRILRL